MRSVILSCSNAFLSIEQSSMSIKCMDALFIGNISGLELVISDILVLIGSGKLSNLLVDKLIAVSRGAPLIIGKVIGKDCFITGSKFPIVVYEIVCRNTYLCKCLVNKLQTNKAVFGENVTVKNMSVENEVVFNDPYVWFEDMSVKPSTKLVFNYDEFRAGRH